MRPSPSSPPPSSPPPSRYSPRRMGVAGPGDGRHRSFGNTRSNPEANRFKTNLRRPDTVMSIQTPIDQPTAINGAFGEGGGQILRTSLSLAMCTGHAIHITAIRAGRAKPGLMRQHLTAVRAAAEVCNATIEGAHIGSQELLFVPGEIASGRYQFAIGTAGSTTLVWRTLLPALLQADARPVSLNSKAVRTTPWCPALTSSSTLLCQP
jgi:hypothetical protein